METTRSHTGPHLIVVVLDRAAACHVTGCKTTTTPSTTVCKCTSETVCLPLNSMFFCPAEVLSHDVCDVNIAVGTPMKVTLCILFRTQDEIYARRQAALGRLLCYPPALLVRGVGEETFREGTMLIFEGLQCHQLNKQVSPENPSHIQLIFLSRYLTWPPDWSV